MSAAAAHPTFFDCVRPARRVLVLDLGFLGDTIHLFPALHALRQALPEVELHAMAAAHVTDLFLLTPWVQRAWGYPRFPKAPPLWKDLGRVRELRRARFDAIVNLNGTDRTAFLTGLSGAQWRLGRVPERRPRFYWRSLFTHQVEVPYYEAPLYRQRWQALGRAGFPLPAAPAFGASVPPAVAQQWATELVPLGRFLHLNPFTTLDYKELPTPLLAAAINHVAEARPDVALVVSIAPNERERRKLAELLPLLRRPPARVFDGNLGLVELAAVVARAALHLGGDSGGLHVAQLVGVPTVTWFREYRGRIMWQPEGAAHRVLVGTESPAGLQGIAPEAVATATLAALAAD